MIFGTGSTGVHCSAGQAWRRATALFIILVFTLFDACRYAPQVYASPATIVTDAPSASFSIPKDLGRVEESFRGTTDKTIFFIQDAHDSLEAQENIAKLISKLVKEKGIKTVFEEGYEGPVPTDKLFGFMKDPAVKQKVSYFLLDKLRVGGAEYAHINRAAGHGPRTTKDQSRGSGDMARGTDWQLIGVEELKLYGENLNCYQESSQNRKDIETDLGELLGQITTLANQYFPKDLKTCLKGKELFSEGKLPLLSYLKELQRLFLKGAVRRSSKSFIREYPALERLLSAERTQDPKLIKQLNALDSKVVFEEILQLEQDISNAFLQNERDQRIFTYYQQLILFGKLNRIVLTQPEYEAAKETLLSLDTQKLVDFIVSLTHRSLVLSKEWERHIKDAVRFYDVAQNRDGAIDQHIKTFRDGKEDAAILVFGGFHGSAIKDMLRQQGFSYVVISPKITAIDKRHQDYYKHLMSEGYHSFEVPFLAARANRAPGYPYLAATGNEEFVRARLRVIAFSVEAGNSDPRLIERRLIALSPAPKERMISAATEKTKSRSETRQREFMSGIVQNRSPYAQVRQTKFQMAECLRTIVVAGVLALASSSFETVFAREAPSAASAVSVSPGGNTEIDGLIRNFMSSDYRTSEAAEKKLVEMGNESVARALLAFIHESGYMGTHEWSRHQDAAEMLVKIGSPSVAPLIEVLLHHKDWVKRTHAAELLGKIRDPKATEALIAALNDEHSYPRRDAAAALGAIGAPRAIAPLLRFIDKEYGLFSNDEDNHKSAIEALAKIGKPAVEAVIGLLDHKKEAVRIQAGTALDKMGDMRAVGALIRTLGDKAPGVRRSAAIALLSLTKKHRFDELRNQDPEAFAALLSDKNMEIRVMAAAYLATKKDPRAVEPLVEAFSHNNENPELREMAENFLPNLGEAAIQPLVNVIFGKSYAYSLEGKKCALKALTGIGAPAVEPLIKILNNSETSGRYEVAEVLGDIGDARAVEPLMKALSDKSDSGWTARKSAEALSKIGDSRAIEPLVKTLSDPDRYVRNAAREALIAMHKYGSSERLIFWRTDSPFTAFVARVLIKVFGFYFALFLLIQIATIANYFEAAWVKPIFRQLLRWKFNRYQGEYEGDFDSGSWMIFAPFRIFLVLFSSKSVMETIGRSHDDKAAPLLIDWLLRGEEDVSRYAAEALGTLSVPEAQFYHALYFHRIETASNVPGAHEFVQAAFRRRKEISRYAALVGAELKIESFVPVLISALEDKDPAYQALAVKGLDKISTHEARFYFHLYHKELQKASLVPGAEGFIEKALTHQNATVRETAFWVSRELAIVGKLKAEKSPPGISESMEALIAGLEEATSQKLPEDPILNNKLHRTHRVHFYSMPTEQARKDALSRFNNNAFGKVGPLLATRHDGVVLPFIGDFFMVEEAIQTPEGRIRLRIRKLSDEEIFDHYGLLKLRAPSGEPYEMEAHSLRDVVGRLSMIPGQFGWVERRGHNREVPINCFSDLFKTIISGDQFYWQPARLEMKGFGTVRIRAVHNVFDTATGKPIEIMPTLRSDVPANLDFTLYDSGMKTVITQDFRVFLEMPGALSGTNYQPFFHSPPGLEEGDQSQREKQHDVRVVNNGVSMPNHSFFHGSFQDRSRPNRSYGITSRMSKSEDVALRLRELLHEYDQFGEGSILGRWLKAGVVFQQIKKFMYRIGLNVTGMNRSGLFMFPNGDRREVPTETHETDNYGEIIRTVYGTAVVGRGVGGLLQAQPAYDMVLNNFSINGDLADLGEYIEGGGTGDFSIQYLLHFLARLVDDLQQRHLLSADEAHGERSRELFAAYLEGVSGTETKGAIAEPLAQREKTPIFPQANIFGLQAQTLPEMTTEYDEDGSSSEVATGHQLKNFSVQIADPEIKKVLDGLAGGHSPKIDFKFPESRAAKALQQVFRAFQTAHPDVAKVGLEQQYSTLAEKFESVWRENWPDRSSENRSVFEIKDLFLGISNAMMSHQFEVTSGQQKMKLPVAIERFNQLIADIQRGSAAWIQPVVSSPPQTPAQSFPRSEMRAPTAGVISSNRINSMVRMIRTSAQPATVFVDADDFSNLSLVQKEEFFFVALSNKALRLVVYNERGQSRDKELGAFLKLDRVTRTEKDLVGAQVGFDRTSVPSIHLSKQIFPSQGMVQRLRGRVSFFKTRGQNGGTLAAALLWAWSGGEDARMREISQGRDGFWTVAETLVNAIQKSYDATLAFAIAA